MHVLPSRNPLGAYMVLMCISAHIGVTIFPAIRLDLIIPHKQYPSVTFAIHGPHVAHHPSEGKGCRFLRLKSLKCSLQPQQVVLLLYGSLQAVPLSILIYNQRGNASSLKVPE